MDNHATTQDQRQEATSREESVAKEPSYKCTECGKDSWVRYSDWTAANGKRLIHKDESLCGACAKKRNVDWGF